MSSSTSNIFEDRDSIVQGYQEVQDKNNAINWMAVSYDAETDKKLVLAGKGSDYNEFLDLCELDSRVFGYVKCTFDDGETRFAFITWIGPGVPPLKKAKVSTDKVFVLDITENFSKEILADDKAELDIERIKRILLDADVAQ